MPGRVKIAFVAFVAMPAMAVAAEDSGRHAPHAPAVVTASIGAPSEKHHAAGKPATPGPATIRAFLLSLGDAPALPATPEALKQVPASASAAAAHRATWHHPDGSPKTKAGSNAN